MNLHPLEDDLKLRRKKIELEVVMDNNLKNIVASQAKVYQKQQPTNISIELSTQNLSSTIGSALDYFGFGFVNSSIQG